MAMIKLENVNKYFGDLHVLKDVNLEVKEGEKLVIIGPSGSGKSTTVRCMNYLESPSSGKVIIDGHELNNKNKTKIIRSTTSMVFQQFNLYPHMTVLKNLTLAPMKLQHKSKKEAEKLGVSSGSTSAKSLVSAMIDEGIISGEDFDPETFDPATWTEGVKFQQYDDYPTISTALSAGEVDAFCVDKSILAIYKTEGRSYIDAEFSPQEYGIATTKDSGLSEVAEELVTSLLEDGTIDSLIKENGLE